MVPCYQSLMVNNEEIPADKAAVLNEYFNGRINNQLKMLSREKKQKRCFNVGSA